MVNLKPCSACKFHIVAFYDINHHPILIPASVFKGIRFRHFLPALRLFIPPAPAGILRIIFIANGISVQSVYLTLFQHRAKLIRHIFHCPADICTALLPSCKRNSVVIFPEIRVIIPIREARYLVRLLICFFFAHFLNHRPDTSGALFGIIIDTLNLQRIIVSHLQFRRVHHIGMDAVPRQTFCSGFSLMGGSHVFENCCRRHPIKNILTIQICKHRRITAVHMNAVRKLCPEIIRIQGQAARRICLFVLRSIIVDNLHRQDTGCPGNHQFAVSF